MRRFRFDTSFDEEMQARLAAQAVARQQAEAEAEANAPPTFAQEELDAAKDASFQAGRQDGMATAMASVEQQTALTLDAISLRLPDLFDQHRQWCAEVHHDAIRLANTIMRKVAPELVRGSELPQIEYVINEAFQFLTEQPKVMVRVAEQLEHAIGEQIDLMASRVGYEGQVVLVGDPQLPPTDCRISWAAGAVERSLDEIWEQIDDIVERTVRTLPSRQPGDPPEAATATADTPESEDVVSTDDAAMQAAASDSVDAPVESLPVDAENADAAPVEPQENSPVNQAVN